MAAPEPRTLIDPIASTPNNIVTMEAELHEIRPRPNPDGTFSTSVRRPTEIHPQPPKIYRIPGHSTSNYTARPRSRTSLEGGRRPWNLVIPSSPTRAAVTSDYERSPGSRYPGYYPTVDSDSYLMPASTRSRQRVWNPTTRDGRLAPMHKESSPQSDRGAYLTTGGRSRRVYPISRAEHKSPNIDVNDAYSYTNLTEEYLSSPRREHRREGLVRRPRPVSLTGVDGYLPNSWSDSRYSGPATSSHAFDKCRKDDDHRESGRATGNEASRRHASHQTPVSLHQEKSKPRYRDERDHSSDERGYRIRQDGDGTIVVEDHPYSSRDESFGSRNVKRGSPESAPMGHGGLATAGLARGYSPEGHGKHSDRDVSSRREHRRARRSSRAHTSSDSDFSGSGENSGRHKHRASRTPRGDIPETRPAARYETRHNEKAREDVENQKQGKSPVSSQKNSPEMKQKDADASLPKGILKQPTQKFPEDRSALREGVAPLKDATKKGIPPGARWTKIARRLVNPAALEGYERFEEREDHVIVLRVLTKEEIQAYANKTAEIRCMYHETLESIFINDWLTKSGSSVLPPQSQRTT